MSRCFPFPPPGYEKRLRNSEQESLISKEKHKEKKRKKEKKDKERVENKERDDNGSRDKHNDGSRDKHKEKKDKKEKHKDKKRKREKDKNGSTLDPNNEAYMANEIKDSKYAEELGRRIRNDEQGATNCLAKNISNTNNRRIGNNAAVTSSTVGKERFTTNNTVGKERFTTNNTPATGLVPARTKIDIPVSIFHQSRADGSEIPSTISEKQKTASKYNIQEITSLEKRNGQHAVPFLHKRTEGVEAPTNIEKRIIGGSEKRLTPPNDKHTPLFQNRRTEGIETPTAIEKQKIRVSEKSLTPPPMHKKFDEINERRKVQINQKTGNFATEDRRNHAIARPFSESLSQKGENAYSVHPNQKPWSSNLDSNANGFSTKSNNELDCLVESITSVPESMCSAQATEKERLMFPNTNLTGSENKNTKHKLEDAKTDGRHKDRDGKEKNKKEKDKDRHKKKEEKKKMKIEQQRTNHDKLRDSETNGQINNINSKSLAAPRLVKPNATSADGNSMKRKQFEMNALLHEPQLVERPSKLPRIDGSSPHQLLKNGNTPDLSRGAIKLGNSNNITIKRGMENNGNSNNGKAKIELQPPPVPKPPNSINGKAKIELQPPPIPKPPMMHVTPDPKRTSVAAESSKKELIRARPPHRDTKYLDTIYSLPKMEGIPESDEQDWLFSSTKNAVKAKSDANKSPPKVWAQGLRIDEADIFALPYVVPF